MFDPTSMSPGSIMPPYPWLYSQTINTNETEAKINALRSIGVPYPNGYEKAANTELAMQANVISKGLLKQGAVVTADKEIIALIAYLQRLGTDIKTGTVTQN